MLTEKQREAAARDQAARKVLGADALKKHDIDSRDAVAQGARMDRLAEAYSPIGYGRQQIGALGNSSGADLRNGGKWVRHVATPFTI